jgi:hypothetical protein
VSARRSTDTMHLMTRELAEIAAARFHSAKSEGKSDVDAMQEIIETIIRVYSEAVAS